MSVIDNLTIVQDFPAYSQTFWSLVDKGGEMVRFVPNHCQRICDEEYEHQQRNRGFVRMNILKLRQGGITTWATARGTHAAMTEPITCLTLAHEEKLPTIWLNRSKSWRDQTPAAMTPRIGVTQRSEISFDKLPSRYYVGSAAGGFPGMGDTIRWLHLSEIGSWDKSPVNVDPDNVLFDLSPSMPTGAFVHGTVQIRESTGKMVGDWWHRQWMAGKDKGSEFRNIFLPWFLQEEYHIPGGGVEIIERTAYEKGIAREALQYDVEINDEQLAWRRHGIRQSPFLGDVIQWSCRFPTYEGEAFVSPGLSVYTPEMQTNARKTHRPPIWRGDVFFESQPSESSFVQNVSGEMLAYEKPAEGLHYALGADCQWGDKHTADWDVLNVECLETGKLCAKVRGHYPMPVWAGKIAVLGHHYNIAPVAPERNSKAASGVVATLLGRTANWRYPNIWVRSDDIKLRGYKPEDYGWLTTHHTKGEMIAYSQEQTLMDNFDWCDSEAISQMATIIRRDDDTVGAPKGMHDDDWMARMITASVAKRLRATLMVQQAEEVYHPQYVTLEERIRSMMVNVEGDSDNGDE